MQCMYCPCNTLTYWVLIGIWGNNKFFWCICAGVNIDHCGCCDASAVSHWTLYISATLLLFTISIWPVWFFYFSLSSCLWFIIFSSPSVVCPWPSACNILVRLLHWQWSFCNATVICISFSILFYYSSLTCYLVSLQICHKWVATCCCYFHPLWSFCNFQQVRCWTPLQASLSILPSLCIQQNERSACRFLYRCMQNADFISSFISLRHNLHADFITFIISFLCLRFDVSYSKFEPPTVPISSLFTSICPVIRVLVLYPKTFQLLLALPIY